MAVFIGGGRGSLPKKQAAFLAKRARVHATLVTERRNILSRCEPAELEAAINAAIAEAEAVLSSCKQLHCETRKHFESFSDQRIKRSEFLRYAQFIHGIERPARDPSKLNAAMQVVPLTTLEVFGSTALMVGSGAMTIGSAFGYAAAFGVTSTICAMFAGFQFLRFTFFKLRSPTPEPRDLWIRLANGFGFGLMSAMLALIVFAAARTRITGDASSIWDFTEASLWTTFADANSLLLITIGVCSSIISIRAGFQDLSDPCPGLSDARRHAVDELDAIVEEVAMDVQDLLEDSGERALEALEDSINLAEDLAKEGEEVVAKFNAGAADHDVVLEGGFAELEAMGLARAAAQARINPSAPHHPFKPDRAKFDALRVKSIDPSQLAPNANEAARLAEARGLVGKVRAAMQDATTQLDAAYAAFRASPLDLSPDLT